MFLYNTLEISTMVGSYDNNKTRIHDYSTHINLFWNTITAHLFHVARPVGTVTYMHYTALYNANFKAKHNVFSPSKRLALQ